MINLHRRKMKHLRKNLQRQNSILRKQLLEGELRKDIIEQVKKYINDNARISQITKELNVPPQIRKKRSILSIFFREKP